MEVGGAFLKVKLKKERAGLFLYHYYHFKLKGTHFSPLGVGWATVPNLPSGMQSTKYRGSLQFVLDCRTGLVYTASSQAEFHNLDYYRNFHFV